MAAAGAINVLASRSIHRAHAEASVQEAAARRELADDALQLIADAEVAIDAGEPVDIRAERAYRVIGRDARPPHSARMSETVRGPELLEGVWASVQA